MTSNNSNSYKMRGQIYTLISQALQKQNLQFSNSELTRLVSAIVFKQDDTAYSLFNLFGIPVIVHAFDLQGIPEFTLKSLKKVANRSAIRDFSAIMGTALEEKQQSFPLLVAKSTELIKDRTVEVTAYLHQHLKDGELKQSIYIFTEFVNA